jgi:4-amino-4-deoxychorismate lyase
LEGNYAMIFEPYIIRNIQSFELFDIGENSYDCKFSNRNWINTAKASVSADDVIFTKNGFLKDASYANIVLFDGQNWVTPKNPLLLGTRRASLLHENLIIEKEISINQIKDYQLIKFINAMMLWNESPYLMIN